ncbi:hypothetical protein MFIFM68171_01713 [Madurella fahalii]|uniref:Uncharacterized protein n=1 Tax=Madurella fahalii TaxID=1157608 RepID=A0ABQ0G169_9PEZI
MSDGYDCPWDGCTRHGGGICIPISPPVDDIWSPTRKRITAGEDHLLLSPPGNSPPEIFPFYTPSFDLAVAGAFIFSTLTLVHTYLAWRTKTVLLIMCVYAGAALTTGFLLRIILSSPSSASSHPSSKSASLLHSVMALLLGAPASVLGFLLIMTYTRLTWWAVPPPHRRPAALWLPPAFQTTCLAAPQVLGDALAFFGSGFLFIPPGPPRMAAAGAVVDVLAWAVLSGMAVRFVWVISTARRFAARARAPGSGGRCAVTGGLLPEVELGARRLGVVLALSSLLLVVLGIDRVFSKDAVTLLRFLPASEARERLSVVVTEEWPEYLLYYIPAAGILLLMAIYHPGFYLPRRLTGMRLRTKELLRDEERLRCEDRSAMSSPSSVDESDLKCWDSPGSCGESSTTVTSDQSDSGSRRWTMAW